MPEAHRKAAAKFKKIPGSSPGQIRAQFLQHVMSPQESSSSSSASQPTSTKIRPLKDVLNRIQFDPGYNINDYVIGYIDRKAGILEMPVREWVGGKGKWVTEDCVAYFKEMVKGGGKDGEEENWNGKEEGEIVWDRAAKRDWIFGEREVVVEEETVDEEAEVKTNGEMEVEGEVQVEVAKAGDNAREREHVDVEM